MRGAARNLRKMHIKDKQDAIMSSSHLSRLEHLDLISRVCSELDATLGMADRDLAEFIVQLAKDNPSESSFAKELSEMDSDISR